MMVTETIEAIEAIEDEVIDDSEQTLPYLDTKTREFHCTNGKLVKLSNRELNAIILQQLESKGRPTVPLVEVSLLGGKRKTIQENYDDPGYKQRLIDFESERGTRSMRYVFGVGVDVGEIPKSFRDEYLEYIEDASDSDLKMAYVLSLVPTDDIGPLMEAILGEYMPTQEGVEQVAESFPSNGKRKTD